ncbi:MAG: flavodoxin family protein [archaeon GB-1845-036]|nr:flavodoxin family protein [Candidatus Culexmicrobium thermophilum]
MVIRILGFNGSPRKYGNTFKLLSIALKAAERFEAETEIIHLYDYMLKPCIGCLSDIQEACRYPCVLDDDMKFLYDKILMADGFIMATPVYWYSPSSQMKIFIDRLTIFENMATMGEQCPLEGKVAGIIACGNDSGTIQVIANLYSILNSMGINIPPWALAYYHEKGDVLARRSSILDAVNIGRNIVLTCKGEKPEKWYLDWKHIPFIYDLVNEVKIEVEENRIMQWKSRETVISKLIGNIEMEASKSLRDKQ